MKIKYTILSAILLSSLPTLAGTSSPSFTESLAPAAPSPWSCTVNLYGWAESLDGYVKIHNVPLPVFVSSNELISHLEFAAMGSVEVGYGRWSFLADVNYARVGVNQPIDRIFTRLGSVDYKQEQFLGNFVGMYELVKNDSVNFDIYAGARVNWIQMDISDGNLFSRSQSKSWVDPIIGCRLQAELSHSFFFRAMGDIGGFGVASTDTYQAMAGFGYRFCKEGSVLLGYRVLGTNYASGDFKYDIVASGPVLALEASF
jgi:hypothetical protein